MAENSGIEWTHHTFNPWIGCTKVSPACDNCYAETWNKRFDGGENWGPKAPRRRTKNWSAPLRWHKELQGTGERRRVFCASLADVFDNQVPVEWRQDLWDLIKQTTNLDWLILTKRPQNIAKMLPDDWGNGYPNVWLGMSVENQTEAARRIEHFLTVPAIVHFLSCEPLLGALDLENIEAPWYKKLADADENAPRILIDALRGNVKGPDNMLPGRVKWVITGGESGPGFRHADPDWFRSLRDQCAAAGVPFLFKQWEGLSQKEIKALGRELDGVIHNGYPLVQK